MWRLPAFCYIKKDWILLNRMKEKKELNCFNVILHDAVKEGEWRARKRKEREEISDEKYKESTDQSVNFINFYRTMKKYKRSVVQFILCIFVFCLIVFSLGTGAVSRQPTKFVIAGNISAPVLFDFMQQHTNKYVIQRVNIHT